MSDPAAHPPSGHYFEPAPSVPSRPGVVTLKLPDAVLRLHVDRGVFAARAVDAGTLELLRAAGRPHGGGHVMDLGCGYGPIACVLALRAPECQVWAVDVNDRALALVAQSAVDLGLDNIRPVRPADVPPEIAFRGIWSNPPIRIGKEALHDLLTMWLPRLEPGSPAWLVVQRHLGSDSLAAWMAGQGWSVTRTGSRKGYRILRVETA